MEAYCVACQEVLTTPAEIRQHLGHKGLKTDDDNDRQQPVRNPGSPR